jgi:integrase
MHFDKEHARALLQRVDPGRVRSGEAVGLRDGAVLALIAAGWSANQIASLRAADIQMQGRHMTISVNPYEDVTWITVLPAELGARLLAWLTEAKVWGLPEPVFRGCRGPLTAMGIFKVFERHRDAQAIPAEKLHEPRNLLSYPHLDHRPEEDQRQRERPDAQRSKRRLGSGSPGADRTVAARTKESSR